MKTFFVMVRSRALLPFYDRCRGVLGPVAVVCLSLSVQGNFSNVTKDSIVLPSNMTLSQAPSVLGTDTSSNTSSSESVTESSLLEESKDSMSEDRDRGMYSFEKVRLGFIGDYSYQLSFLPKFELEQKLLDSFPPALQKKVEPLLKPTLVICEKYQIDPFWVFSVMWTESHFKPTARSHVGASGLMQIMPGTRRYLLSLAKKESIVFEYEKGNEYLEYIFPLYTTTESSMDRQNLQSKLLNIELGVFYLKKLLLYFDHNYLYATVAYNMGPSWTKKRLLHRQAVGVENNYLDKVKRAYQYIITQFESSGGSV